MTRHLLSDNLDGAEDDDDDDEDDFEFDAYVTLDVEEARRVETNVSF